MEYVNNVGMRFKAYFKSGETNENDSVISITLIRFTPIFEVQRHFISYIALFGDAGERLRDTCFKLGLELNAQKFYLKIKNYEKLLGAVFPDYTIKDCQNANQPITGHPDYKLTHRNNPSMVFYLELKKNGDGIRNTQLNWLMNNCDSEVWFLFINDSNYGMRN